MYQGTVPRLFMRYALPQMVGLLFNSAYVIVDGVFIGNRLGTRAMAAAAVSVPLIEILIALSIAIAAGAGAYWCPGAWAQGDRDRAARPWWTSPGGGASSTSPASSCPASVSS